MTTKSSRTAPKKPPTPETSSPVEVHDAPDALPRGPVAHVTATSQDTPPTAPKIADRLGVIEGKLRARRAETLLAKGEAYGLAAQLDSLAREFEAKRGELQRAWDKTQRRIRGLDAAIEADEATLALLKI